MEKKVTPKIIPDMEVPNIKHTIELVIGVWKMWFGNEKTKILIVETLNEWIVHEKKLELNGYLITDYSVYLIMKSTKRNFNHLLTGFYRLMIDTIERHHPTLKMSFNDDQATINSKLMYHKPFEKRDFYNDDLIKLMLGKKVSSIYYDLELANLIKNIRHYKYCSAIDYAGAEGPVNIILLADNDEIN